MTNNYIGTGLTFPVQLSSTGSPVLKTGFELLDSSIKMILAWDSTGRIFLTEFRSILSDLLEDPNDNLLQRLVEHFAYEQLTKWEQRIDLVDISAVRREDTRLDLSITYTQKNSNLEHTFVFPFYTEIIY